ncbi:RNA polymerase II elongation factor Ell [Nilaparvata lugens]|uniref:RNA polymerase II elongation factor Ell n=1 Tax=Nilaparvata lugens TaxID=108931 RepID=UPI00193D5B94|nr:RNA polymerase II elongation factor Ell [Nilaparvata lugens]
MAALIAGVKYGLSSQGNLNENKSLIFVKLTDSAYRAIEEYIRNKNNCSKAPTIQFLGNEGHLSLPPSSQSARGTDFNFSLSSNEDIEGPQGSFECIQQVAPRCLESVGALHCKMRVQAKDDVYDKTRQKMAEAEEMHKTKCTREIELDIGRRIKSRGRMPTGSSGGGGAARPAYTPSPVAANGPKAGGGGGGSAPLRGSAKDDITRRSIRDRLIHMLAVRPYKKPELHAAVQREGLREKDRNQLMATLSSVAMQRDNTYHLLRHVWNDVTDDWPFYTAQDRQTLKRRKPQNLTPPGSSDGGSSTSSGQSPNSLQPGSPPQVSTRMTNSKRPGYVDGVDGFLTKRQRISRVVASAGPARKAVNAHAHPPSANLNANSATSAVRWTTPSPTPVNNQPITNHNNQSANGLSPPSCSSASFSPSYPPHHTDHRPAAPAPVPPATNSDSSNRRGNDQSSSITSNRSAHTNNHNQPKYLTDYPRIESVEERRRYKADFNTNYMEYRALHSRVDKVARKFANLEESLKKEPKDSPAWKTIKNMILEQYDNVKVDKDYQSARQRFNYLHNKLSHIKQRVLEYDTMNCRQANL